MAIAGVVNLLLPDCIVLGGGLVESLPKIYLDEVAKELKHRVMPAFGKAFSLKTAELGDDAGVLGAAAWARQILDDSTTQLAELAAVE
jgi:glucokinase